MKRLIRKADQYEQYDQQVVDPEYDDFLSQRVEVIYNKSKWLGYVGTVDDKLHANEKYVIYLDPRNYEGEKPHRIYVSKYDAYKWLHIIADEQPVS